MSGRAECERLMAALQSAGEYESGVAAHGATAPLSELHRTLEHARARQHAAATVDEAGDWMAARGAVHQALALRGSTVALYDLRELLERLEGPPPVGAIAALRQVGDATCLDAIATAWTRIDAEASRASTLVGLAELLLSGCTTVFDHTYLYQNGNSVDVQVEAAREIGVRFHASRGSMSVGRSKGGLPPDEAVEDEAAILRDSERVVDRYHDPRPGAMTRVVLAPCAPFSVSADLLRESAALARAHGVRLHTHLAETRDEERYTLERFGVRPVEWMDGLGWVYIPVPGSIVYYAEVAYSFILIAWVTWLAFSRWRTTPAGNIRQQCRLVSIGLIIIIIFGTLSGLILPLAGIYVPNLVFIGTSFAFPS